MCLGHQCAYEEDCSQSSLPWGRTHEEDYLTETSPQVWSFSGFASREAENNAAAVTAAPFCQGMEMVTPRWVHTWCHWPCSASAPQMGCAWCHFLFDYQRQGVLREGPYVTVGIPVTLRYISGKCHHHHCQPGDTCRRGLGDLPWWRGALEESCGGSDETWEKQLFIYHSSEASLQGELRENSFKIFITDHQKVAQTFLHWCRKCKYKQQWLSSSFSLCHHNETTKNICPTEQLLT